MLTTTGSNTAVVSVEGNFDDCQTMVKELFSDPDFAAVLERDGYAFSSANSINWGRLVPQIVYYYWAYWQMLRDKRIAPGDPVHFAVPTGNFGNILAGWYAMQMGLPVGRLICASNQNRVLADFFKTGSYTSDREFFKTSSPSMDILISSNLERFLYHLAGGEKVAAWYEALETTWAFSVDPATKAAMDAVIHPGWTDEAETAAEIARIWSRHGYLMDTHTAVGCVVAEEYRKESGDGIPIILDSTASPYKFGETVYEAAFGPIPAGADELALLKAITA